MDIFKVVVSVLAGFVTIATFVTVVVKPLRQGVIGWVQNKTKCKVTNDKLDKIEKILVEHIESDECKKEALKCMLRNEILHIYYRYLPKMEIPTYQFENLTNLYNSYVSLGGNSFIKKIYEMISTEWKVI